MPYKELCEMYKNAREHYFRAYEDAIQFARSVYGSMKNYMGISDADNIINILPNVEKVDESVTYTPENSVNFGASTDWEFCIQLKLHLNADLKTFPPEIIKFSFFYKRNENEISYRFMSDMKDYVVKEQELPEHLLNVCFPEMEKTVEKFYHKKLTIYSKDIPTQRKIGLN